MRVQGVHGKSFTFTTLDAKSQGWTSPKANRRMMPAFPGEGGRVKQAQPFPVALTQPPAPACATEGAPEGTVPPAEAKTVA